MSKADPNSSTGQSQVGDCIFKKCWRPSIVVQLLSAEFEDCEFVDAVICAVSICNSVLTSPSPRPPLPRPGQRQDDERVRSRGHHPAGADAHRHREDHHASGGQEWHPSQGPATSNVPPHPPPLVRSDGENPSENPLF